MLDVSGARKIRSRNPSPGVSKPMSIDEGAESRQQTGCRAGFPRRRGERFWNSVYLLTWMYHCVYCVTTFVSSEVPLFVAGHFHIERTQIVALPDSPCFRAPGVFFEPSLFVHPYFGNAIERCIDRSLTNVYNTMVRLHDIHDKWPTIIQSSNASE